MAAKTNPLLKVKNLETGAEFEIGAAAFVGMKGDTIPGTNRPRYKVLEGQELPDPAKKK